jgi:hypothetical protein
MANVGAETGLHCVRAPRESRGARQGWEGAPGAPNATFQNPPARQKQARSGPKTARITANFCEKGTETVHVCAQQCQSAVAQPQYIEAVKEDVWELLGVPLNTLPLGQNSRYNRSEAHTPAVPVIATGQCEPGASVKERSRPGVGIDTHFLVPSCVPATASVRSSCLADSTPFAYPSSKKTGHICTYLPVN